MLRIDSPSGIAKGVVSMSIDVGREGVRAAVLELLELLDSPESDIAKFEEACMTGLMSVGQRLMAHRLEALTPTKEFVEAGETWRVAVHSKLPIMTTFGPLSVKRPLFRSKRNGPTRCMVQERCPLVAGFWTERAAKLGALAVSEMPMERAEKFFAESGFMTVSRSSLLRLVGSISTTWEENREEHEQAVREKQTIPDEATLVTVSLDGVMVLMVDSKKAELKAAARVRGQADKGPAGWSEASVGVVSFYDKEGVRLETRRFGRMPEEDKATTKGWIRAELEHIRKIRPDLMVQAIADGAANNWSFLGSLDADYETVDFYHTAEHLHRHVSKANGASTVGTQGKLHEMRRQLLDVKGGSEVVFADFKQMREDAGTQAPSTTKTSGKRQPTFFDRHHGRMNYAELREAKLPIGSGVTESTCKLTICDRMRRTGMRWSAQGGQAVITLRAHQVSGAFNAAWDVFASRNRRQLTEDTSQRMAA